MVVSFVVFAVLLNSKVFTKDVTVSLDSKWKETPLLLEASEFIASENPNLFWSYVADSCQSTTELQDTNEKTRLKWISDWAKTHLTPSMQQLLTLSLTLRTYSPEIASHQQIVRDSFKQYSHCDVIIDMGSFVTCDPREIKEAIGSNYTLTTPIFDFDHVYSKGGKTVAIVYGQLGTKSFAAAHHTVKQLAEQKQIKYILRHMFQSSAKKVSLSSYGVELAIKSTEYRAVDDSQSSSSSDNLDFAAHDSIGGFQFSTLHKLHPDLKDSLDELHSHLIEESASLVPLKVWQLSDLSFQASSFIKTQESSPIDVLQTISQNFPSHAHMLSKVSVLHGLQEEVAINQDRLGHIVNPGDSMIVINGFIIDLETVDLFSLLEFLHGDMKILDGISAYKIDSNSDTAAKLLLLDVTPEENNDYAVDVRDAAVIYVNDIESESRYNRWPQSLQYLLQPTFPGSLRRIAKNIHHLAYVVDPANVQESLPYIVQAHEFYENMIPVRIGIVLVPKCEVGNAISKVLAFIYDEEPYAIDFLIFLSALLKSGESEGLHSVTMDLLETTFKKTYSRAKLSRILENSDYDVFHENGVKFFKKSGFLNMPIVLYNGKPIEVENPLILDDVVIGEVYSGTTMWQRAVWNGVISDSTNLLDYVMSLPNVMPRLNDKILNAKPNYIEFMPFENEIDSKLELFSQLNPMQKSEYVSSIVKYFTKAEDMSAHSVSLWILGNFDSIYGRDVIESALKYLKKSDTLRIAFISTHFSDSFSVSKAMYSALISQSYSHAKMFINKIIKVANYNELMSGSKKIEDFFVHGMSEENFKKVYQSSEFEDYVKINKKFISTLSVSSNNGFIVIANGKVFEPFDEDFPLLYDDIDLLDRFVSSNSGNKILKELKASKKASSQYSLSDLTMKISSLLTKYQKGGTRIRWPKLRDDHSVIKLLPKDSKSPSLEVNAAFDPLSRTAQKFSPVLKILNEQLNAHVNIFLNCHDKWSEMPLKNYYKFAFRRSLEFEANGNDLKEVKVVFSGLPGGTLLTLNMLPPESWLVDLKDTPYDLDNLLLKDIKSQSVLARYELDYILLEGHCYEKQSGQPPRGLQFILGTPREPEIVDTIVMANLGYFQLKANPGAWNLQLRSGPSKEIYDIVSTRYTDGLTSSNDVVVVIRSFTNKIIHVNVQKKPGMQKRDVLGSLDDDSDVEDNGIWNSVKSFVVGENRKPPVASHNEGESVLNIFSVASGHLYERLLRIMCLSVVKHTNAKVKFWFLKNFLSPKFKDTIPIMAKEYNFEYELVQYKWPRWLNQQSEKQRIIWGYKILFLDVLFPLNVKKIIFVDADQIVRADLTELRDINLEGAPYGYTPFCDDRPEMDGFRFWKHGYWANHLAGRRYHISALYVVDLYKFRKIAAGDRLRGQYQGLSQDPNSLANLDQDLPNNMIHQVRIKSLPQEWLWCETWCSQESKAYAKTIDLCNDPMTKEPKLNRAHRIAEEWDGYDAEIDRLLSGQYRQAEPSPSETGHVEL